MLLRNRLAAVTMVLAASGLACGPPATTVLRPVNEGHCPSGLTVQSDFLYWVDYCANKIARMPVSGGAPEVIVSSVTPDGFAVDEAHVYWLAGGSLFFAGLSAGPSTTLASGLGKPIGLAVNASSAFFTTNGADAGTWELPLSGGAPRKLSATSSLELAPTADALYATRWRTVTRIDLGTGEEQVLAAEQDRVGRLVVTPEAVVWGVGSAIHGDSDRSLDGGIMSAPLDGGPATLLAATTNPAGLASDGASVVWSFAPMEVSSGFFGFGGTYSRGGVSKADLATRTRTNLYASPSDEPDEGRIAIDATDVYWVTEQRAVMKTLR